MTRLPGDPGAGRQALFALGARLPDRNREWVRHELTDADWRGRLIVRHLGIVALYADDIRVSRLRRHGLPAPDDPDLGRPSH